MRRLTIANKPRLNRLVQAFLTLSVAATMTSVRAQSELANAAGPVKAPAEGTEADKTAKLDTVTVSATRRREPVREVPMQVNTLAAEQLTSGGAKSLADYVAALPGVDLNSNGNPGYGDISMRGVTTGRQTVATVGVYVDDVAVGSSSGWVKGSKTSLDMSLLDLKQVEVLRGPQGTLYGAGAMGGLLKYVTNEPDTYEFSGKAALSINKVSHGGSGATAHGVVNIPVQQDVAAVRLAVFSDRSAGFVDAIGAAAGNDINEGRSHGARMSALLTPAKGVKLRLTASQQSTKMDGWAYVNHDGVTGQPVHGELTRQLYVNEPYNSRFSLLSAELEVELGWARFNSITSRQHNRVDVYTDDSADLLPVLNDVFNLPAIAAYGTTMIHQRRTSQEFRLTSTDRGGLEWLAGYYYTAEQGNQPQLAHSVLAGGAAGPNLVTADLPSTFKEHALYGDLTWKLGSLSITGGLRAARNRQDIVQTSSGLLLGPETKLASDSSDRSNTYLLTAGYKLNAQSSAYLRWATGYRSGGPNTVLRDAGGTPLAPATYRPDTLKSLEAGYKADLLDRRMNIELAGYRIHWDDVQQFGIVNGIGIFLNGGTARVQGVEANVNFRLSEAWQLRGAASFIDAKLTSDWTGLKGKSGDRMPNSARFSASAGLHHSFSVAANKAFVDASYHHVGARSAGFVGSSSAPYYLLPSYGSFDVQAGIEIGRLTVNIFARNLFDDLPQLGTQNGGKTVSVGNPRTVGIGLSSAF